MKPIHHNSRISKQKENKTLHSLLLKKKEKQIIKLCNLGNEVLDEKKGKDVKIRTLSIIKKRV